MLCADIDGLGRLPRLADWTGGSLTFVFDRRAVFGRLFLLDSSPLLSLLLTLDTERRRFLGLLDLLNGSFPFFAATASPAIMATAAIPPMVAPAIKATSRQNVLDSSLSVNEISFFNQFHHKYLQPFSENSIV